MLRKRRRANKKILSAHAMFCAVFTARSERFKFSVRDDSYLFDIAYVDLFGSDSKIFLDVASKSTRFQTAQWFLFSISTEKRCVLHICWTKTYCWQRRHYHEIRNNIWKKTITARSAQIQKQRQNSISWLVPTVSIVESYDSPVWSAFLIINDWRINKF